MFSSRRFWFQSDPKLRFSLEKWIEKNVRSRDLLLLFIRTWAIIEVDMLEDNRCIPVPGFSRPKSISVAKSARLLKSATKKRDPKKHLSLSICDRKQANRIPRLKVGISLAVEANVKVTPKSFDYCGEIVNRQRSFGSNQRVKVGKGSDQSPSWTLFPHRDRNFWKNFGREHANAPNMSVETKLTITSNAFPYLRLTEMSL